MTAADIDGDGVNELIGCSGRQCDAFDVVHQTTIWETFSHIPRTPAHWAAGDVDGDGRTELFAGDLVRAPDPEDRRQGRGTRYFREFQKQGGTNFLSSSQTFAAIVRKK